MILRNETVAGTTESGDARVTAGPGKGGLHLTLSGPSVQRYEADIRSAVMATLAALGINDAAISIEEKGALDATIRARLTTACSRAAGETGIAWEVLP